MNTTYYFLDYDIQSKGIFIENYSSDDSSVLQSLSESKPINENSKIRAVINGNISLESDILDKNPLVVSEKFKKKIENSSGLEFIPVNFYRKNGLMVNLNFYAINIVNPIDCIDIENSNITFYTDSNVIRRFENLQLKEESILNKDIFRIKGFDTEVVISSDLKNELSQLKGIKLTKVEDLKHGYYAEEDLW